MAYDEASQDGQALAEGRTNPQRRSVVQAQIGRGGQLYYRPETHEILIVSPDRANAFEQECRLMDRLAYDLSCAKEACLAAEQKWIDAQQAAAGPARSVPQDPQSLREAENKVDEAYAQLDEAQEAIDKEFEPLGKLDETGGKLYELIPILSRRTPNPDARTSAEREGHAWGKKWTYVRSDKVKSHIRGYRLNEQEQKIYQPGSSEDRQKIDVQKIRDDLTSLQTSAKWRGELEPLQGVFVEGTNEAIRASLEEWANGVNSGDIVKVEPEFQLLRYFAGAGAEANWNPKKGNVAVRGDARAEFSLAEGKFVASAYVPHQGGWHLEMTGKKSKKQHDLGLVRFGVRFELFGMAGASACGQIGVQVDYSSLTGGGNKPVPGMRGKPARKRGSRKSKVNVSEELRDGAEVAGAVDLFAGARVDGKLVGSLEWNNPEEKKFSKLADIGPALTAQAGAGIGAAFQITYNDGKFRCLAAASICWGLGAGGKLEFEVDVKKVFEMAKYLAYTLYNVGYELMEILATEAFDAWRDFSLWAVQKGKEIGDAILEFGGSILAVLEALAEIVEKEADNIELMNRVLGEPEELEYAPPETKGMILYRLTRHGKLTKALSSNYDWTSIETLGRRKRAILTVCKKVRSRAEFRNVMQHMTKSGGEDPRGWELNLQQVKDFLDYGIAPNDYDGELQDFFDDLPLAMRESEGEGFQLDAMYARLYDHPISGYAFVDNDSPIYIARAEMGTHDGFMVAGGYDPGSPVPDLDNNSGIMLA